MRTIDALLARRARTHRDTVFLRFEDGDLTFAEVEDRSRRIASGLAGLGIEPGQLVAMMLPNGRAFAETWFGASMLGAVAAPVNTAFRGPGLAHVLNLTHATVLVIDGSLVGALRPIAGQLAHVRTLVVDGEMDRAAIPGWTVVPFQSLAASGGRFAAARNAEADPAIVLFTSGTTGRSKGCVLPHRCAVRQAELLAMHLELTTDDVLFSPFPLFHLDASVLTVLPALEIGRAHV